MASLTVSLSIYSFPCPGSWYRLQSQWKILAFALLNGHGSLRFYFLLRFLL